jgi:hypothetical protein
VVIPVMTQHYTMLQRNLLYTGVTRGKRLVVLVGQKKAVAIAVRSVSGRRRWSKLTSGYNLLERIDGCDSRGANGWCLDATTDWINSRSERDVPQFNQS